MPDRFESFIKYCKNRQIRTVDKYIYFLEKMPETLFDSLNAKEDAFKFTLWIQQNEGADGFSYIKNYRLVYYAVKSYLKFLGKKEVADYLDKSPIKVRKNKEVKHWDVATIDALIDYAQYKIKFKKQVQFRREAREFYGAGDKWAVILKPDFERKRDPLFIKFLFKTGMRCSEGTAIRPIDLDESKKQVYIKDGKGGVARQALITEGVLGDVKQFIRDNEIKDGQEIFSFYPKIENKDSPRLQYLISKFGEAEGKKVYKIQRSLNRAENMLRAVGRLVVKTKTVTPHQMRHSLAMLLHRKNVALDKIQVVLGHSDISTTQIYAKTTIQDVKQDYDNVMSNSP